MTEIQSIIFYKKYYTLELAKSFLKEHKINPIEEVEIKDKYYRFRLIKPNIKIYNYEIKSISSGIRLIFQHKR